MPFNFRRGQATLKPSDNMSMLSLVQGYPLSYTKGCSCDKVSVCIVADRSGGGGEEPGPAAFSPFRSPAASAYIQFPNLVHFMQLTKCYMFL